MSNIDLDKGGRIPQLHRTYLGPTKGWIQTDEPAFVEWVIDGVGAPITIGFSGTLLIPYGCVIYNWFLTSDVMGSVQIDIWKMSQDAIRAGGFPSAANTITGSAKPNISANKFGYSAALTGWTTLINQNDVLAFNVDTASSLVRVTLVLQCVKTVGQFAGPQ